MSLRLFELAEGEGSLEADARVSVLTGRATAQKATVSASKSYSIQRDVAFEFIGLRPGEKLHEELFHPAEPLIPTGNPAILLAAPRTADYAMLARSIDELEENARARREERVLQLLGRLVPEYRRPPPRPSRAAVSG